MPLYEYRCRACGQVTEVLQKVSDPPKRRCEKCSGRLDKLLSRTSFHLKGGGWYSEGYGKAAPSTTSSEGGGDKAGEAKPGDKAGEAKPKSKKDAPDKGGSSSDGTSKASATESRPAAVAK